MRKMKESGLEWIGEIPYDWSITKIKFILSNENDSLKVGPFGSQLSGSDFVSEGYWVYSQRSVLDRDFEHNAMFISKDKFDSMKGFHVRANDILITTRGTIGKICRVPKSFSEGILHPCIIKFRIDEDKYSYKLLELIFNHSGILQKQLNFLSNATTIEVIYSGTLKNLQIPFPPLDEQKRIADFLDEKCSEIDSIKADVQRQIELLNEYKKSIITEAVTKGLNPKAKLKDSGIEWIGKIPAHWESIKAKYLFKQRNAKGNSICLQLLSPSQKFGVIPQSKLEELTTQKVVKLKENINLADLKTIHKGDFCISLRSFQGGFEYSEYEGVVSPAYQVFYSFVSSYNGYHKYLFKEKSFIEKMNSFTMSLRDGKNIAFEDFANTEIPVPPLSEQKEIADYLDEKCSEIDAVIADKQKQLETLDEYKKSLIFEYVTGKKEVVQ